MKKILTIICLLLTTVLFIGCGKTNKGTSEDQSTETTSNNTDSSAPKSDDLYSFEISLNGKSYTLPADFSEFQSNGWDFDKKSNKNIGANQITMSEVVKNGKTQVYMKLANTGKDELPPEKCKVAGVSLDSFDAKNGATLVLPKGITLDTSTKDDVIKAYGNPTESTETNSSTNMNYSLGTYQDVKITIDKTTNKVQKIDIENAVQGSSKSSNTNTSSSSSTEVPDSVKSYTAPTDITDDLLSFNVKYDGVLYHMPAPVSEFEKNGWTIQDKPQEDVASRGTTRITLRKENQKFTTTVYNNSSKGTSAENCFVTEITAEHNPVDPKAADVSIELPKGITIGSTKEELETAYSGVNLDTGESADLLHYTYSKKTQKEVDIIVDKKTEKVSKITVQYVPGREDYK